MVLDEISTAGIVVCGLGTLFAGTFGFGDSLVAMPLLLAVAKFEPVEATPTIAALSMMSYSIAVLGEERSSGGVGMWRQSAELLCAGAVGAVLGIRSLEFVRGGVLRLLLGAGLVLFSVQRHLGDSPSPASSDARRDVDDADECDEDLEPPRCYSETLELLAFGLAAGVTAGSVFEAGPVLVALASRRRWPARVARVMLARFFVPIAVWVLLGFASRGLVSRALVRQAAASLPSTIALTLLGRLLNARLRAEDFTLFLNLAVAVFGAVSFAAAANDIIFENGESPGDYDASAGRRLFFGGADPSSSSPR